MTATSDRPARRALRRSVRAVALALAFAAPLAAAPEAPPRIDLTAIFADSEAWLAAAADLEMAVVRFEELREREWRSADDLLAALRAKDEVHRRAASVDGYLGLRQALGGGDAGIAAQRRRMDDIARRWEASSEWFGERVRGRDAAELAAWLAASPALAPYRWLLEQERSEPPRPVSAREREVLGEVDAERRTARDLYTALAVREAPAASALLASGEPLQITPASARNLGVELAQGGDRAAARRAWLEALGGRSGAFATLLGGVVRREAFEARLLGWESPLEARYTPERIPVGAVDALLAAARAAAPAVARYHAARAAALGLDRYTAADLRYPLSGSRTDWRWEAARTELLAAAAGLGEEYTSHLRRAFDEGWIDAADVPGKNPLGFSTFVYGRHPYVSVVFRGATADLFRLAHELGHAVHHQISFERLPFGVARPTPLVGEAVAAVHELLLAHRLAAREGERAMADLEGQTVERLFVATSLDADFERAAHSAGEALSADTLGALYLERLRDFHGGAPVLEPWDRFGWIETPHFFREPFYMARYGLAFAAAAAIVEGLESKDGGVRETARRRYLELLGAGAEAPPLELLRRAGADLQDAETLAAVERRLDWIAARIAGRNPEGSSDVVEERRERR